MRVRSIAIGGIVASLVIGMWVMIVEAILPGGAGLFGPVIAIGATVVRDLEGSSNPIPIDANSIVLAAVFGLAASRFVGVSSKLVVAGAVYGIVGWAVMWFIALPLVDPLMLNLNGLVFLLGHMMWGAALGFLCSRVAPHSHQHGSPVSA